MSQQYSAGHSLIKLASTSAFAGPILFMYFLTITFLALLKPFCANNVFPHQAGITQCSPCFLKPRPPTYPRCRWNCWSAQCPTAADHPGSLTMRGDTECLVHSSCGENLLLLLSSQGLCTSLPISAMTRTSGDRQPVFKS